MPFWSKAESDKDKHLTKEQQKILKDALKRGKKEDPFALREISDSIFSEEIDLKIDLKNIKEFSGEKYRELLDLSLRYSKKSYFRSYVDGCMLLAAFTNNGSKLAYHTLQQCDRRGFQEWHQKVMQESIWDYAKLHYSSLNHRGSRRECRAARRVVHTWDGPVPEHAAAAYPVAHPEASAPKASEVTPVKSEKKSYSPPPPASAPPVSYSWRRRATTRSPAIQPPSLPPPTYEESQREAGFPMAEYSMSVSRV